MRKFSQEELTWRAENAAWNLRRDIRGNRLIEELCPKPEAEAAPPA